MQHVNLKIFAREESAINPADAIPVFHRWIQNGVTPEMLIDVTDYAHVPSGPGVVLIGHQANYSLDYGKNRLGLLYNRKTAEEGSTEDKLRQAWQAAMNACDRLEREPEFAGKLLFDRSQCEVILNDRLLTPNTEETWTAVRPAFETFFDGVFGPGKYTLQREGEPRERFRVSVRPT